LTVTTQLVYSSQDTCDAGTSYYPPLVATGIFSGDLFTSPEQLAYQTLFEGAVFSDLWVISFANTGSAATTFAIRKNGTTGANSVSIPAGTNGTFEDSVDTTSGVSGDTFNYIISVGAGTGTFETSVGSMLMASGHTTSWANGCIYPTGYGNGSIGPDGYAALVYGLPGGTGDFWTEEEFEVYTARFGLHDFGLLVYVVNNSVNGSTTLGTRKNLADGNQSVSVPASTTGSYTDSVDSDDYAYGDAFDYVYNTGSATLGEMDTVSSTTTCYGTDGVSMFNGLNGFGSSAGFDHPATNFMSTTGDITGFVAESSVQLKTRVVGVSLVHRFLAANLRQFQSTPGNSYTITGRKNAANGNIAISIPVASTGYYEDLVDSDPTVLGDTYDSEIVTPSGGTDLFFLASTYMKQYLPFPTLTILGDMTLSDGAVVR
jgi:hypothetical protein